MSKPLGQILIEVKVIQPEQREQALKLQGPILQALGQLSVSLGLATEEQTAERNRLRILVVEDNPINLELMVELLEHGRYEIATCGDGREVMRQVKVCRPDLILFDINLPHIDGLTLARMLREDQETRSITIVAVSAYSVSGDEERIHQAGCDGCIPKPIDTKGFLRTVSTFLTRGTVQ